MAFFHNSQNPHIQNFSNSDNHNNNNNNHHHHHHPNRAVLTDNIRAQNKIIQKCTKRKRNESEDGDKSQEVIQVRAKRGQATDSHSLAERERRKKINERLKCLQTLVPGCYETMGMAVMLDAVISYVTSLQNQIEFLSMKLSAASMYYDSHTMQGKNSIHHEINDKIDREERFGEFCQNFR